MSKQVELNNLYELYKKEFSGEEIVNGGGNCDAQLVLVGEAPGKDEVRIAKPFVGMAGKNLDEFLNIIEMDRDSIYITNAIKYRLSRTNPKTGRIANRPATRDEIDASRKFLYTEINIIRPQYIITLGNVPLKAVTGDYSISIGTVHGTFDTAKILDVEYKLFPLYHPASIIYNKGLKTTYINDIIKLKESLNRI